MDIAEFRAKYPQYDAIDDAALADKLYSKHYAGKVDRAKFDERFLGAAAAKPSLASRLTPDFIEDGAKAIAGAVKGDAEFGDMGNVNDIGRADFRTGMASMFGNDEDYRAAYAQSYPDDTIEQDENGNYYAITPEGGRGYINRPGLDAEDVTRGVGKMLSFVPAAGAAAKAAGYGMLARVGAGAGASAATDAGMQVAAGRDELDKGQVATTAALGGAAEAAAPVLGRVVQALRKKPSDAEIMKAGIRQARSQGIASGMTREEVMTLGRRAVESGDLVSPSAAHADAEFGYKMTRGQAMPDGTPKESIARFKQLNEEEALRQLDGGEPLRQLDKATREKTSDNVNRIADMLAGGRRQGSTSYDAAPAVREGLLDAEKAAKGEVDAAYNAARSYSAEIDDSVMLGMADRVREKLAERGTVLANRVTDGTMAAIKEIADNPRTTIAELEAQRQGLASLFSSTMPGPDKFALRVVRDEYDTAIGEAVERGLFTGDPQALSALKEARGLHARYARKFRDDGEAGKVIQKILDDGATDEQVSNYLIGVSGITKPGAARAVDKYAEIVGRDSDAFNAFREMAWLRIAQTKTGETKGGQALVGELKTALDGKGQSLMKSLYTEQERAKMRRFVSAIEATLPTDGRGQSSGTAERLMRYVNTTSFGAIPGIRHAAEALHEIALRGRVSAAARMPTQGARPISAAPATGATSTGSE